MTDNVSGSYVLVEGVFAGGERVQINCGAQAVTIDGEDASKDVALGSDFFALSLGAADLAFEGCPSFNVRFFERASRGGCIRVCAPASCGIKWLVAGDCYLQAPGVVPRKAGVSQP